jgi:hypothetical protein
MQSIFGRTTLEGWQLRTVAALLAIVSFAPCSSDDLRIARHRRRRPRVARGLGRG